VTGADWGITAEAPAARRALEENHHCLIRIDVFGTEAWNGAEKISVIELSVRRSFPREPLGKRAVRNEADAEFFESGQNLVPIVLTSVLLVAFPNDFPVFVRVRRFHR
jgi:hypothetical protein